MNFIFIYLLGRILEADTERTAIGGQCSKRITPPLRLGQALAQLAFIRNGHAGFFSDSRNSSNDSVLRLPILINSVQYGGTPPWSD